MGDITIDVTQMIRWGLENPGNTFFGGKNGYDVIVFDNSGKILASGNVEGMIEYATRFPNLAVAALIPIMFSKRNNPLEDKNA